MSTKLQNLATFWQNFGLANVQKGLDEVATEITARQDESDTSRKALIELLRDFKKTSPDEVKQTVSPGKSNLIFKRFIHVKVYGKIKSTFAYLKVLT